MGTSTVKARRFQFAGEVHVNIFVDGVDTQRLVNGWVVGMRVRTVDRHTGEERVRVVGGCGEKEGDRS